MQDIDADNVEGFHGNVFGCMICVCWCLPELASFWRFGVHARGHQTSENEFSKVRNLSMIEIGFKVIGSLTLVTRP